MFGYNQPTLEKYIGVPFGFGLLAYAIVRLFPSPEAIFFFAAIEINVAIIPAIFLIRQFTDYEKGESEPAPIIQPVKAYLDMNKADERGNVYAQATETISINAVKAFNLHIITQSTNGFPVIMTENYWTKKEPGMEQSRWVKIGGTGPTDWKDMMARGLKWGAYKTEGGLEKRVINSLRKVGQLAQGYPLPTWDDLKRM